MKIRAIALLLVFIILLGFSITTSLTAKADQSDHQYSRFVE